MSLQIQLNRLLNNLSDIFYKEVGSNVYNFFLTIANELYLTEGTLLDIKNQININTATGDSLDLHGQSFGVFRSLGEGDLAFRARILASFIRPQVTKPRLISAVEELSSTTPIIEEHIIDKWFLEGSPNQSPVEELVFPNTSGQFVVANTIAGSSFPDIFPFFDVQKTGTNYGSGSTFTGFTITPALNLPSTAILYQVTYTPEITEDTPTSAYDMYGTSFLGDNTILHPNNVHNNVGVRWLGESIDSTEGTTIAPSANIFEQNVSTITTITGQTSAGYGIDVEWWKEEDNHVYRWRTTADKDGVIVFDESRRIDSEIGSERQFADTDAGSSVNTAFDIANVVGVFDGDDSTQSGTNYYIETFTETVTAVGKHLIEVTHEISDVISIYIDEPLSTDANYWEITEKEGNFFTSNEIHLNYGLPQVQQPVRVTYLRKGEIQNGKKIVLPQNVDTGKEVIVRYRKNPIINYQEIPFFELLYAGHADTKFTFEVQIQQGGIIWGDNKKWGEGWKWGQFDNVNTQTTGEVIDISKAAGTKAFVIIRTPTGLYGEDHSIYAQIYYGSSYY